MQDLLADAVADNGKLRECMLYEVRSQGNSYEYEWWFRGRLCAIAPKIDTSRGVQVGMTCFCLSKTCQLQYQPFVDFVYTPVSFASNIDALQTNNVFQPQEIKRALFSRADMIGVENLISTGKIGKEDTIADMLSKTVNTLQDWLKRRGTAQQVLAYMPEIHLQDYIKGDLCLTEIVQEKGSAQSHPYVKCLVEDFMGSMQNATILDAVIGALGYNDRQLTIVPASRHDQEDKITIVPCALAKYKNGDDIKPQHIISYSISANPIERLRQPDKLFVKVPWGGGWGSQNDQGVSGLQVSSQVGQYAIKKDPQRIKMLYTPKWLFDIILQQVYKDNKSSQLKKEDEPLTNKNLYSTSKQQKEDAAAAAKARSEAKRKETEKLLNIFAKNMFFSTYRLHTYATIHLAVTDYTLNLDEKLGKSVKISIPTSAKNMVGRKYTNFYGRLQSIGYSYQSAKSVESASSLLLSCTVNGVTSEDSQGSTLFKEGNNMLYVNKGSKDA